MKIENVRFAARKLPKFLTAKSWRGAGILKGCPATEPYVCVVCNMHEGGCGASSGYYDSAEKAIAAWNRRAEPENNPLTLDELRQMDGEPVYVIVLDKMAFADKDDAINGWGLCRKSWVRLWDGARADIIHIDHDFEDCGKTWLAYARKPESEAQKLYSESENFIQNKFGYCFYSLGPCPLIYNLYVHPQYRRKGHSSKLLMFAISEIRKKRL